MTSTRRNDDWQKTADKHDIDHGLPAAGSSTDKLPINLHTDEFNELKGGQLWKIRMSLPKPSSGDAQES